MIDLAEAVKLCESEDYIIINGSEYTPKQIKEKFDMRKIKVTKIRFDRWNDCIEFITK